MAIRHSDVDIRFDQFVLQPGARQVLVDGKPLRLGQRAFDVLIALIERRERCVGKDELMELVWPGLVVEENNLQVHISALRKEFGASAISTIPGRGYRFTAAVLGDATPSPSDPKINATMQLPEPRNRFVGRVEELNRCSRLLEDVRLLTLIGMGGCGKTRLALEVARRALDRFDGDVWFVDLAPLQDAMHVASAVAVALGVCEEAGTPLIERVSERIAGGSSSLLLLDNCEHVIEGAAAQIDALLRTCPRLKVIATSRELLGLTGEQSLPVRPMSLATSDDDDLLHGSEAVRLFVDRAGLASPDFSFDADNAAAVGEICRQLDGIPLAIELAAARTRMMSIADIAMRLSDRFRFLTGGDRMLPRHQTLVATLAWSYESLDLADQRLFRQLAVFVGGFTLAAAAAVANQNDQFAVLEQLTRVHDKSLLTVDIDEPEPRYRMLETVRQYARMRLDEAGEADVARARHRDFYVAIAEEALKDMHGPRQGDWLRRIRLEQGNVQVVHAWSHRTGQDVTAALKLVASLWRYWVASAQLEIGYQEARRTLASSTSSSEPVDSTWQCRALWAAGQLAFRTGCYSDTLTYGDECLSTGRATAQAEHIAAGLILRAGGSLGLGRFGDAEPLFEEAISVARALGPNFALVAALHGLAEVRRALGHFDSAEALYRDAIASAQAIGDARAAALPMCNLAGLLVARGQLADVRALLLESMALGARSGLRGLGEHLLEVCAGLATARHDHPRAARYVGAALACMHEAGSKREPLHEAFVAPLMAKASSEIGPAEVDAARAEGRAAGYEAAMGEIRTWLESEDRQVKRQP